MIKTFKKTKKLIIKTSKYTNILNMNNTNSLNKYYEFLKENNINDYEQLKNIVFVGNLYDISIII